LDKSGFKYLFEIDSPKDLKKMSVQNLQVLCDELRDYMVHTITQTGGHLGAGLGIVELTVALHYVYNTPDDKIIFDVGHQGYPHKILTGRRDQLNTIRKKGGLSGFLKTAESPYDAFGAGHASTSISAALGIATARDLQKQNFRVVAVIGDGAMTGGEAFEAMNNCGVQKRDITVILNDNNMSIDRNVSAFSNYFNEIFASSAMSKVRENVWKMTERMDNLGDRFRRIAGKLEGSIKSIITPGILFEAMGFNYIGPINGHNMSHLVRMLQSIKDIHGPILFHVFTEKGKGYGPAERDVYHLHAIGKLDTTNHNGNGSNAKQYQKVFGEAMVELCEENPKLVGITAAMGDGTSLDMMEKAYPSRFFDVGIAESHAVTFAAGLAMQGMTPVCAIYSTFLQRAFDQVSHDVALQNLHVIFAIDRAGIVGADGATHHGTLDMCFLRSIPNMVLMAPKDEQELRDMLYSAVYEYTSGPVAIRYPRGKGTGATIRKMQPLALGKGEIVKPGQDIAILAVGKMVNEAMKAAQKLENEDLSVEVVNARFIKPLDHDLIDYLCEKFGTIITVEDGQAIGGFGSAVLEYIATRGPYANHVIVCGIPDHFVEHGSQEELLHDLKLDAEGIAEVVRGVLVPAGTADEVSF
jgi:1-deoxy-D-xylulose-5-phosphate synthase